MSKNKEESEESEEEDSEEDEEEREKRKMDAKGSVADMSLLDEDESSDDPYTQKVLVTEYGHTYLIKQKEKDARAKRKAKKVNQ